MKTLTKGLTGAALCSIALTGCGSDKKDKADAPSITATTPSSTPTFTNKVIQSNTPPTPTSTDSIHSVTPTTKTPTSTTSGKNNTSTSTTSKVSSSSKVSGKSPESTKQSTVTTPSSKGAENSRTPSITPTSNYFQNTKNVIWASSGDFTNKKLNNKAPYNYKNLDKGLYTIDVNCSGGSAKLAINNSSPYNVICNGASDDNVINACLKNKSDVNSVLEAASNKVKYIWQMRKVSNNC